MRLAPSRSAYFGVRFRWEQSIGQSALKDWPQPRPAAGCFAPKDSFWPGAVLGTVARARPTKTCGAWRSVTAARRQLKRLRLRVRSRANSGTFPTLPACHQAPKCHAYTLRSGRRRPGASLKSAHIHRMNFGQIRLAVVARYVLRKFSAQSTDSFLLALFKSTSSFCFAHDSRSGLVGRFDFPSSFEGGRAKHATEVAMRKNSTPVSRPDQQL